MNIRKNLNKIWQNRDSNFTLWVLSAIFLTIIPVFWNLTNAYFEKRDHLEKLNNEIIGRFNQLDSKLERKMSGKSDSVDGEQIKCVLLKLKQSPRESSVGATCTQFYSFHPEFSDYNIFALLSEYWQEVSNDEQVILLLEKLASDEFIPTSSELSKCDIHEIRIEIQENLLEKWRNQWPNNLQKIHLADSI